MFCHKCGTEIAEGAAFCHRCGTKVAYEGIDPQPTDTPKSTEPETGSDSLPRIKEHSSRSDQQSPPTQDTDAQNGSSKFKSWWDSCSKAKKILTVLGGVLVGAVALSLLVSFLREFGYLLFGIAVIGGFIITLTTGSEKEKIETRKAIVQMVIGIAFIIVVVFVLVLDPDLISDIVQPGAGVRNAHLSQYSDEVTIEDAFQDFFANEKWSTYKADGYSYVVFTGACEYDGEQADVQITFKITGDNFRVDHLDLNGVEQNDFMLALMLAKVYENY